MHHPLPLRMLSTMLQILLYQLCIWNLASGNMKIVTGMLLGDVILPCNFTPEEKLFIYWSKKINGNSLTVHMYEYGSDQPNQQGGQYKNRTKLFINELPSGNASLLLSKIQLSDKGTYECHASNNAGLVTQQIYLQVSAAITHLEFNSTNKNGTITIKCTATGFPKPCVRWINGNETEELSIQTVGNNSLHSVTKTLNITHLNQTYACTAHQDEINREWKLTWKMQDKSHTDENCNVVLQCAFSEDNFDPSDFLVTWSLETYIGNKSQVLSYISYNKNIRLSDKFKERAFINESKLSEMDAALYLKYLTAADNGEYTCNVTSKNSYQLIVTRLRVDCKKQDEEKPDRAVLIRLIVIGIVILIAISILIWYKFANRREDASTPDYAVAPSELPDSGL